MKTGVENESLAFRKTGAEKEPLAMPGRNQNEFLA